MLDTADVRNIKNLIKDSFRVRENHDPIYVDLSDNYARFSSAQQQVLFGRRGSGKSSLLVHLLQESKKDQQTLAIYINVDEIKTLKYPDVLIRVLLSIFQKLPGYKRTLFDWGSKPLRSVVKELKELLDQPESADVSTRTAAEGKTEIGMDGKMRGAALKAKRTSGRAVETTQKFVGRKLDYLERHLQDYKTVLRDAVNKPGNCVYVLVDDFYLIDKQLQPDVVDYLHRLLRGTSAYLKLATIRHRTILRRHESQTIGVELSQDIEEISLDKTFEDFESTNHYLHAMLDEMVRAVAPGLQVSGLFNADAGRALTLVSGGVPRDFLNIFVEALELSVRAGKKDRLTPTFVYKAAAALSYKSKLANLKEDAGYDSDALERLFADLVAFCLGEKKKTVFLINHADAQAHSIEQELLQQLMDFKLIHLVGSNTSAASGRAGRFAAYTLDFSIFMEPRRRGIEIVEFWNTDEGRRTVGMRESPEYSLDRASRAVAGPASSVERIDGILDDLEVDNNLPELVSAG